MRKRKHVTMGMAILMAGVMTVSLAGCGSGSGGTQTTAAPTTAAPKQDTTTAAPAETAASEETTAAPEEVVVNHARKEGLPIADEEITLVVGVKAPSSSYQGAWEDLDWVKQLQEAAGVKLEFEVYNGGEDVNLMFASRDFPDITFNLGSDKQIQDAALGGDVVPLDDLIAEWSPNWSKYFAENDVARRSCLLADGKIYSLPIIRDEPSNCNLRDQWLINKGWLDELGLEVPTTTDEFYNVLKAFKENAGKGSIPENVIPYYIYGVLTNIGGGCDIINSFGLRLSGANYRVTVDDDGKVEYNFVNKDIIEPLLYMRKLFEEELIPYECLTDNNDTYLVKTKSDPPIVGSFHSYQNPDALNETIVAMGPLDSGNGKKPYIRSQTNWITKNYFTIYSNCKYPEVAMRLADLIAEPDWSIQGMYGMFGDTYLKKNDDGSYAMYPYAADAQGATSAPMNRVPLLLTSDIFERFTYMEGSAQGQRATAVEEVYKDYTIPRENLYPDILFTTEQTDRLAELKKDLNNCINNTFATWMLEGGIEEGWDEYEAEMKKLGADEYVAILQEALDAFNAQ